MEKFELNSKFMLRAIELAKLGRGRTNPNPMVGAVIVKDGVIIGEGFHKQYGSLHAEREAILDCRQKGNSTEDAAIYVTLEPCCHYGKQPPCTQAILDAKIATVVVGSRDPNPLVAGKGVKILRDAGVNVVEDFLRDECDRLNSLFFSYISSGLPYVALKYAMTMDGKIATVTGKSKWITSERSRSYVHQIRSHFAAILCGINTVLADDPLLTCRPEDFKTVESDTSDEDFNLPLYEKTCRVILDSDLKIPLESRIVKTASETRTIVVCAKRQAESGENSIKEFESRKTALKEKKIEILEVECADGDGKNSKKLDAEQVLKLLAQNGIDSVLVEGGGEVNFSMLKTGAVKKIYAFIAPKIFGGAAKGPVMGEGVEEVADGFELKIEKQKNFDGDIFLELGIKEA
ncbi:MAG: bifunctional diaminohydroxyphosphoribosylaminopyrimidine deaminase/5-amino-6-(5-phosphoribosylamino)uracil reductase RibD [Treponema sp.]|nr:bifunctional diaminohydroxyphosphoribosylaminopyrimidine deaminase/5-amino-6-(5-phosphoribosylamino)uracil reductase RibD [Treponema sp.]MBR0487615.1 bifunctional diaminohydroxyphosphoribosylaminopyrimidine deaminase/5-amino-6-(5-phosphoribosylamino)uracil reductase RibD [Treponema sp.]